MLYIVLLPVKSNDLRSVAVIKATNYERVREILGLPDGWNSFVSLTDIEVESVLQSEHHHKSLFLGHQTY